MLAFPPKENWPTWAEAAEVYTVWPYWLWISVMAVSQSALLAVPVRFANRRPVTRGALWPTVLAAGLMAGGLVAAALCTIYEFGFRDIDLSGWKGWSILSVGGLTWIVWAVV